MSNDGKIIFILLHYPMFVKEIFKMKDKKIQIRNSTVDFLVFTRDSKEEGIEVRVQDNDVWLTQKSYWTTF